MSTPIFRQFGLPVFQNKVYSRREDALAAVVGDVELVQCPDTGLVSNALFDSGLLNYDESYQNEQALSPTFRHHLEQVLALVVRHFWELGNGVEIGCGKGYFLESLLDAGLNVTGFDPAYQGNNRRVHKHYYRADTEAANPDYIVLRHVLEHISNPWDFLRGLAVASKSGCGIYIEVPCFDWIVEHNACFDVFYEHCNYFTLDVLRDAFGRVLDLGRLFGGQYLFVIADVSTFRLPQACRSQKYPPLNLLSAFDSILASCAKNRRTYVWGAGAKGMVFTNIASRYGLHVDALVDINPVKQGCYIGLAGTPILSPEWIGEGFENANVVLMNPVYEDEVASSIASFHSNLISVV